MSSDTFSKVIDKIQGSLIWFVVSMITICIAVLIAFDALAGTGTMLYLTNGLEWQSVILSLATTGLLFALMFIGYMMTSDGAHPIVAIIGKFILVFSGIIYVQDIIFDALLADILRYGYIDMFAKVDLLQWMFRGLLGGISTVGDALGIVMIIGMPVLKTIIQQSLGTKYVPSPNRTQTTTSTRAVPDQIRNNPKAYPTQSAPKPNPAYVTADWSKITSDMNDDER